MHFCAAILILKMDQDMQHFWHIMLYYFKKGKNATETQEKICAAYGEGAVTDPTCQKWFAKFLGTTDIWPNSSLPWDCLMHWRRLAAPPACTHQKPIVGDSRHTQNIHSNKVIGENEKCVFYFMEKTKQTFWSAQ